ncbi:MAG: phospholipase D-like domain-containing protein [Syntrophorhabdales bacterium]|jgi:phosphatidylserine/phosphatidylglycerophosphate/cardiolipin synthase-like enzyme
MPSAEEFAEPSYKWIGPRHLVDNLQGWRISLFPGGLGFSFLNYSDEKALRVRLAVKREDGVSEFYLSDASYVGEWGGPRQKWQTDRLPLFPYEGLHGLMRSMTFSYSILKDGVVIPSRYEYRFATLDDFYRGRLGHDDFRDPEFLRENNERPVAADDEVFQDAYDRFNASPKDRVMTPLFTRGDAGRQDHPVHEIHRAIDRVIDRKRREPAHPHSIRLAMFDFDNEHVTRHLVYAHDNGVGVECIGDWAQVSPMNASENIARLRRAGIRVYGIVRNDPSRRRADISSMHTKFILFDNDVVHSGSYNLHFHLWGGNWENGIVYRSPDASLLHLAVYRALKSGQRVRLAIDPSAPYNLYYSFGAYHSGSATMRAQDAIVSEIARARHSIVVCMFDLSPIRGIDPSSGRETDVIQALIRARDRGVRVQVILNGMITHAGPLPEPWDKAFPRPLKEPERRLKDAWIEVYYVYYWESVYSPLHHKFAVFDGQCVITGSYNWYEPSLYSDEVLSVTRDETIAASFLEEAELLLSSFRIERA